MSFLLLKYRGLLKRWGHTNLGHNNSRLRFGAGFGWISKLSQRFVQPPFLESSGSQFIRSVLAVSIKGVN